MNQRQSLDKSRAGFKNTLRINIGDEMIKMVNGHGIDDELGHDHHQDHDSHEDDGGQIRI